MSVVQTNYAQNTITAAASVIQAHSRVDKTQATTQGDYVRTCVPSVLISNESETESALKVQG